MNFTFFGEYQLDEKYQAYLIQKSCIFHWENCFIKEKNAQELLKIYYNRIEGC